MSASKALRHFVNRGAKQGVLTACLAPFDLAKRVTPVIGAPPPPEGRLSEM